MTQAENNNSINNMASSETVKNVATSSLPKSQTVAITYQWRVAWARVIFFSFAHILAVNGIYLLIFSRQLQIKTILFMYILMTGGGFSITAGCHRLWAHRSYSARLPLRVLLAILQLLAVQYSIYDWVRDHRVHHKFTDTNADPYNSSRGFFFSHIGWLLVHKHPDVVVKGRTIPMKDLEDDPVVMYQKKYYWYWVITFSLLIPSLIPYYFWNEVFWYSIVVVDFVRLLYLWHVTWLVNSLAHAWGTKPYNKNSSSTENPTVAFLAHGEGWHNYHHAFPWDYKAAELGNYRLNFTTAFIDGCAWLGLAYNRKTPSVSMVKKQAQRTGDGTYCRESRHSNFWGWGDEEMTENDKRTVQTVQ